MDILGSLLGHSASVGRRQKHGKGIRCVLTQVGQIICLVMFGALCATNVSADSPNEPVRIDPALARIDLTASTWLLEDPEGKLTLDDVRKPVNAGRFKLGSPGIGVSPSAYWLRIAVESPKQETSRWWFDTGNRTLQEVDLYSPDEHGVYRKTATGSTHRFADRPLPTTTFVFPITLHPGQVSNIFLRVRSTGFLGVAVKPVLWQPDSFNSFSKTELSFFFFFLGIGLALGLFNLMLFLYNRDPNNLWYVSSLAAWMFALCSVNGGYGSAYQLFWPNSPIFEQTAWVACILAIGIFPVCFIIHLLDLPKTRPRSTRAIYAFMGFSVLPIGFQIVATALQLPVRGATLQTAYAIGSVPWALTYVLMIYEIVGALRAGSRSAKFVFIAFTPILMAGLFASYQVQRFGEMDFGPGIAAGAFEFFVMALAVADRFYQLRVEKRKVQIALVENLQKSEQELESKVAQRTSELQQEQIRTKSLLNKNQHLLHNMLPIEIAEELSITGRTRPARHESATILFTDFSEFTQAVSTMPADRMLDELNEIFAAFDDITDECGVEKIKTIGDAYMAAAGLPKPCSDHAQRCVRAGLRMVGYLEQRNKRAPFKWQVRVGIHSGPVVAGVVGKRKYAFDIWGDSVNLASRMESSGEPGRVNVSAYTYDLIQNEFECVYRGKVDAKGKGSVDMYFVASVLQTG